MTAKIDVKVPDIDDTSEVKVIEFTVAIGDLISVDDTVVILETDKATLDVPAEVAGRVVELNVAAGDCVTKGTVLLRLEAVGDPISADTVSSDPKAEESEPDFDRPGVKETPDTISQSTTLAYASPSVRKFARELGVDISALAGTGPKGRISKEDVQGFVKKTLDAPQSPSAADSSIGLNLPPWPEVDFAAFGEIETVPLSRIAKISGSSLARNAMMIPHVTNFEEADVTDLEAFRKTVNGEAGDDIKLSILPFVVKAAVAALKAFPEFNSSLVGDALVLKKYYNIGVAADTPEGLVVPVVKDADKKSVKDIAAEMADLSGLARAGRLKISALQGATFTISSLGGIGGANFTPIINAPEVAILGLARSSIQPVWDGAAFQPRLIQPMSLSWDHRVVDGVAAARFLLTLKAILTDFRRISL